ncbi:MAG: TlpA family protein disulfide reductase, partial [Gemmatimonadota bacterium]|nr:TlpA family protein disulfide reductase [Gemmatimonadota bacterium]
RLGPQIAAAVGVQRDLGRMPPFTVESLDGEILSRDALRGKVVLVNFWATWCGPCRVEMPGFQKVYEDLEEEGFVILGLATDREGRGVVQRYVEERGVTYPIALSSNRLEQDFGGLRGLPMSYLVDRNGVIRHRVFGFFASPTLRMAVGRLLDEDGVATSAQGTETGGAGDL